ncbi:MAG TPA: hypothetical protein VFA46_22595 [Actinomycetes bacterium]|nr:hypothetical protein [Actinomycetes bacterium]
MQAHELVEAGRRHVARGQVRQAMACFTRAADDPEQGAEALSLLAAAYLLPGACAPDLALANAHRAARHPRADREHLTRCAMVALTAGDPVFADELAARASGSDGDAAAAIGAIAKLRQDDRVGLRRLLRRVRHATGPPPFWRRLVVEAATHGWLPEALVARRLMRRGGLPAPDLGGVLVRALPPPIHMGVLLGLMLLALAAPVQSLAQAGIGSLLVLGGVGIWTDRSDGRLASACSGLVWMVATAAAWVLVWYG